MNINMTNPENPPERPKPRKIDWGWRDGVIKHLKLCGVPHAIADVAVIDMRPTLDVCYSNKLSPESAAAMLIQRVEIVYNKGKQYEPLC